MPFAHNLWTCLVTQGIRQTGGNHQLLSLAQSQINASAAPETHNLELNFSTSAITWLANWSTVWGPPETVQ